MARIKRSVNALKKRRKVLKSAKGYYGTRSRHYRVAKQTVMRAMSHAFVGRKLKKRQYRRMWIVRINAAARMNGVSYSVLMSGLKKAGIEVNRKLLAELALNDPAAFTELVNRAKKAG
ncbi:MAG: 50S ribosomal protein L20 [Eubacteriales bacterium]|nr:50S ribosomal protein L20 [Eubacteriales bacterium]